MKLEEYIALIFAIATWELLIFAVWFSDAEFPWKLVGTAFLCFIVALIFLARTTGPELLTEEEWKKRNEPTIGPEKK